VNVVERGDGAKGLLLGDDHVGSINGPITAPGSNPSATFTAPAVSARHLVKAS
jgi:hypothetical protein